MMSNTFQKGVYMVEYIIMQNKHDCVGGVDKFNSYGTC